MGKGLRERWAEETGECVRPPEKRVIFGEAWGVSRSAGVYHTYDFDSLRNICSLKEFGRSGSP